MQQSIIIISILAAFSCKAVQAQSTAVVLHGELAGAERLALERFNGEPFTDSLWMRSDLTFEKDRIFTNYSGDVSGRFLEIMALLSRGNLDYQPSIRPVLDAVRRYQCAEGYFGDPNIDWNGPVEMQLPFTEQKIMPTLWGNARLLCGIMEMYHATGDPQLLAIAERMADFYIQVSQRFLDPKRVSEFMALPQDLIDKHVAQCRANKQWTLLPITLTPEFGDTGAAGYVTCWFPAMEGLMKLYLVDKNKRYLELAEKMAEFYQLFDVPNTGHVHGMLCCQYALLMLYQTTGKPDYLKRVLDRWDTLTQSGVVCPLGGMPEAARLQYRQDEGCEHADWLRVNLKLYDITHNPRYLDMADRLMHNQFLINEWSTGGFGHRSIFCDEQGIYGYGKHQVECVWCCNYHATLAFGLFKDHLFSVDKHTLTLNFSDEFDGEAKGITIKTKPMVMGTSSANVLVEQNMLVSGAGKKRLAVRIPEWADSVLIRNASGVLAVSRKGTFATTKTALKDNETLTIQYIGGITIENRRLQRVMPKADAQGNYGQVVIRRGPKILFAENRNKIPTIQFATEAIQTTVNDNHLTPFTYGMDKAEGVFVFDARAALPQTALWPKAKAEAWAQSAGWFNGVNYIPSDAINYTAMWDKTSFNPALIDRELALAQSIGLNCVRVVLQYAVYADDPAYFVETFERFLALCAKHGIRVMPIFFDDCAFGANNDPVTGRQPEPLLGWYAWAWSPSPGHTMVIDSRYHPLLEGYVKDIMSRHKDDARIFAWDLYNEPTNGGLGHRSLPLVKSVFRWAREINPSQPLTIAVFTDDTMLNELIVANSDIISFHCYADKETTVKQTRQMQAYGRPVVCSEWMNRPAKSFIAELLPFFKEEQVGSIFWGLVNGKTQTNLPWGFRPEMLPYNGPWQHDIFRSDFLPYDEKEIEVFKQVNKK